MSTQDIMITDGDYQHMHPQHRYPNTAMQRIIAQYCQQMDTLRMDLPLGDQGWKMVDSRKIKRKMKKSPVRIQL